MRVVNIICLQRLFNPGQYRQLEHSIVTAKDNKNNETQSTDKVAPTLKLLKRASTIAIFQTKVQMTCVMKAQLQQ